MAAEATAQAGHVKTKGLCHIAIKVMDMEKSILFYTGLFNLRVIQREEGMAFLNTPGKPDSLALFGTGEKVPHDGGLAHFGFFVDDENFDRALSYVKENGIKVRRGPGAWHGGGRFVYVEDPDGYEVQISVE
jgi:catechol 2,3-dioxygenase-like lactoylglutathione lyase family enzyme